MTIKSLAIERELERRLTAILRVSGFQTDAGLRVYRGWAAHYMDASALDYPLIVIQPGTDGPSTGHGAQRKSERVIHLLAIARDTVDPAGSVAELLHDMRRALYQNDRSNNLGGLALSITEAAAETEHDGAFAIVSMPITVAYTEQYL